MTSALASSRLPVERVEMIKAHDPHRQRISELFQTWDQHHGDDAITAAALHDEVKRVADPQNRGRQYLAAYLSKLTGTRAAGFVLTRQEPVGAWRAATYSLRRTATDGMGHREHRDHRTPMPPMVPMPDEVEAAEWTL